MLKISPNFSNHATVELDDTLKPPYLTMSQNVEFQTEWAGPGNWVFSELLRAQGRKARTGLSLPEHCNCAWERLQESCWCAGGWHAKTPPPSSLEQGLWTPAPHGWPRLCPFAFGASSDKTTDCQSLFSILSPYPFQKSSVPILPSSSLFSFKNVLPLNYCPMSLFYCLLSTSAT